MVSPRKSSSALSLIPEERGNLIPVSTKSCESLYSNTSSSKGSASNVYRRKPSNGHMGINRQASLIPATTEVRQRVLSARRLRMKTYQNQLADAQQTIAELAHENRILRTLHKRQDSALAKYESTNAELPKLLHSHSEELRVWQTKYRTLQQTNKELEHKLKQKESIILTLGDQNKYYSQLNKDRNLEERQRLSEKLEKLETRLKDKDNDMKLLARRVQIENKNFKQQILNEQKRTKEVMLKLEKARLELSGYRKLDELGDKFNNITIGRRKATIIEETKLDQDLEKILAEHDERNDFDSAKAIMEKEPSEIDFLQPSTRSVKSLNTPKMDLGSSRTIRKSGTVITSALARSKSQRLMGGTISGINARRNSTIKQKPQQQQQQPQRQRPLPQRPQPRQQQRKSLQDAHPLPVITDYEDVFQNGGDDSRRSDYKNADSFNGDGDEGDTDGEEEEVEEEEAEVEGSADRKDAEVASHNSHNYDTEDLDEDDGETDENHDENDEEEAILNTAKKTSHMKEEISSIRKQICEDFKEREAFLDTFCRQATTGVLLDETPKKRNAVTLGQNLPSSRKNKLLAALKAIDDNKSQE